MRIGGAESLEDLAAFGGVHGAFRPARAAFLGGERGGALRGAARDAFVVRLVAARESGGSGGSASDGIRGLASSGIMTMQSTGQGATHSSQPVQSSAMTVCMRRGAPTMASTGQGGRHLVQPMQRSSSMNATVGAASMPLSRLSGASGAAGELRQRDDGFGAAGRALVDVGFAARDGLGVGQATRVAAARALRLRSRASMADALPTRFAQVTFIPGSAPLSGDSRNTSGPSSPLAHNTMPCETPKRILRGSRLAIMTTWRPMSFAGS